MTTNPIFTPNGGQAAAWSQRWTNLAQQSQRATTAYWKNALGPKPSRQPDPMGLAAPIQKQWMDAVMRPDRFWMRQWQYNANMMDLWSQTARRMWGMSHRPTIEPPRSDKRWRDAAWSQNPLFDLLKQSHLLTEGWLQQAIAENDRLDDLERDRLSFFTRQFASAISPTNFPLTNPKVLRQIKETGGQCLLDGLENLLRDIEEGDGQLNLKLTDESAFEVGKNVATAPGQVVYENDLIQLLQFNPTTEEVAKRPLLIVPPWINKYYILDLRTENSFIRWAVDQGHTVFVVSWVNPDESLRHKGFEDYLLEGPMAAIDAIEEATGEREINAIGYCIGGTLMSCAMAYMDAKGDDRVQSITFLATLTDFEDVGQIKAFINDQTLDYIDSLLEQHGYLPATSMAQSFNMLRENDLIWNYAIDQYLLGQQPTPFDLLYWNSDATRMPQAMHRFYLRSMYRDNLLVKPGGVTLDGVPIDLRRNKKPTFIIAASGDHIAPWASTYKATQLYQGPVHFVLGGSGHIAGIVNPPNRVKYGYRTLEGDQNPADPQEWLDASTAHEGSWWNEWNAWITDHTGPKVPARSPQNPIEPAPGRYSAAR